MNNLYMNFVNTTVTILIYTMSRVAVIGAGVIGLSSALHVLEQCPSVEVTVFADSFPPNTTTNVSAGFWLPHLLGNTPEHLIRKWSGKTLDHMLRLAGSDSAKYTGACIISGYELREDESDETPLWADMVQNFRHVSKSELVDCHGMRSGFFFTTACLEPGPYLEFLMKRIQRKGAILVKRRVASLSELSEEGYDVIVNCTGFGARDLVKDKEMQAVRGQIVRLHAPWIKQFYIYLENSGKEYYIIPSKSYVVAGGTEYVGDENTNVDINDRNQIWKGCTKYVPSLTEATIDSDHVGLRPARPATVRLEQEIVQINGKPQIVVHNYGHGGGGVTLHWGCAGDAASLVKHALQNKHSKSRL